MKQRILNKQLLAVCLATYILTAIFYGFSVSYASSMTFSDTIFYIKQCLLKYLFMGLWTLPIYWLLFEYWVDKTFQWKLWIHCVVSPAWLYLWLTCFHKASAWLGMGFLQGRGVIWDVFISFLFYVLQFAVFHAFEFYLKTIDQKKREKELLESLHLVQLSGLKAQLQPHFLFNTLNSISASVPLASEHTRQLIAQLADTFRYALHLSKHDFVPLKDEIAFIKNCLDLEHERFGDRLKIDYQIPPSVLEHKIPSMLLQPLVENALKHGITPQIEGGSIALIINELHNFLYFEIADTGKGLGQNTEGVFERGVGLRNTALRLEKLYGETIVLEKNEPNGLTVKFKLPIRQ
jgi:two-component system, LytTR family, sensor kinase